MPGFRGFIADVVCRLGDFGPYAVLPEVRNASEFLHEASGARNQEKIVYELGQLCSNVQKFRVCRQYVLILFCMVLTLECVVPPVVSRAAFLHVAFLREATDYAKKMLETTINLSGDARVKKLDNFDLLFATLFKHASATTEGLDVADSLSYGERSETPGDKKKFRQDLIRALPSVCYDKMTHDYVLKPEDKSIINLARSYFVIAFEDYRKLFLEKKLSQYVEGGYDIDALRHEFCASIPEFGRTQSKRMPAAGAGGAGVGSAPVQLKPDGSLSAKARRKARREIAHQLRLDGLSEERIAEMMSYLTTDAALLDEHQYV
jgi:hypothetical protein